MKFTNSEIHLMVGPMQRLLARDLPVKVSYKLLKAVKQLETQTNLVEKMRIDLLKKYGTEAKGTVSVEPGTDSHADFLKDFNEILVEEVEIEVEAVQLPDTILMSTDDLMALEKLVTI